jgi:hypothetical protein
VQTGLGQSIRIGFVVQHVDSVTHVNHSRNTLVTPVFPAHVESLEWWHATPSAENMGGHGRVVKPAAVPKADSTDPPPHGGSDPG